ncbi:hypothetical protein NDU88_002424 [Pleurodeles waltl]|uniref:Uncharacterized protein n=1 Tax=Pleurodeles waltl TaxID=8319 RepID=A0AAV7Q8T7_PLEWA|nr:hypothetical protein NDU88_002424 [Pleurodeles waltl]
MEVEEYLDSAPVVRLFPVDSGTLENDITPNGGPGRYTSPEASAWDRVQVAKGLSTPVTPQTPIICNLDFPPALDEPAFLSWQEANYQRPLRREWRNGLHHHPRGVRSSVLCLLAIRGRPPLGDLAHVTSTCGPISYEI